MDIIIFMAILGCIVFFVKRTFSGFVYAVAITDIMFRLLTFLKTRLLSATIAELISKYIPASIPALINKYTNSHVNSVLMWIYVVIMIIFEFYSIRTFIKKR